MCHNSYIVTNDATLNGTSIYSAWVHQTLVFQPKRLDKNHPVFVFHGENYMYFRDFTETETQMNPWWAVDLGRPVQLTNLVVHNRKSPCCGKYGLQV